MVNSSMHGNDRATTPLLVARYWFLLWFLLAFYPTSLEVTGPTNGTLSFYEGRFIGGDTMRCGRLKPSLKR